MTRQWIYIIVYSTNLYKGLKLLVSIYGWVKYRHWVNQGCYSLLIVFKEPKLLKHVANLI